MTIPTLDLILLIVLILLVGLAFTSGSRQRRWARQREHLQRKAGR